MRKRNCIGISQISSESYWDTTQISTTPRRQHKGIGNCRSEGNREQLWQYMRERISIWSASAGFMDFPTLQKFSTDDCKCGLSGTDMKRLCGFWRNNAHLA